MDTALLLGISVYGYHYYTAASRNYHADFDGWDTLPSIGLAGKGGIIAVQEYDSELAGLLR